jgi:uncharacterized membrane protein
MGISRPDVHRLVTTFRFVSVGISNCRPSLMALDHTRDFFTGLQFAPEDLALTSGPLFFTRFVTHSCAPVFFLLAGTAGYLSLSQGKSVAQVSRFFWTRGLWLVLLDLTVIAYGWTYVLPFWFSDVLWSLGWSMVEWRFSYGSHCDGSPVWAR